MRALILEMRNKIVLAGLFFGFSDQFLLLPPFEYLLLACTTFISLFRAIVGTLLELFFVFFFLTVSPFLKNLQWQFLELRQQVLHGARGDWCSCPDTACPWGLITALKPQQ